MPAHIANGVATPCHAETGGYCRLCALITPGSPDYREDYAALYGGMDVTQSVTVLAAAPTPAAEPCCGGQPPGLLTRAANFARAALEHVAAGSPEADEPTASARLAICLGCEHLNAHAMTCNLCGCSMPRKVYWGTARCPIGKW